MKKFNLNMNNDFTTSESTFRFIQNIRACDRNRLFSSINDLIIQCSTRYAHPNQSTFLRKAINILDEFYALEDVTSPNRLAYEMKRIGFDMSSSFWRITNFSELFEAVLRSAKIELDAGSISKDNQEVILEPLREKAFQKDLSVLAKLLDNAIAEDLPSSQHTSSP